LQNREGDVRMARILPRSPFRIKTQSSMGSVLQPLSSIIRSKLSKSMGK